VLDRDAAGPEIVGALASMSRGARIALPMKTDEPEVTGPMLITALRQTRAALSAPVVLTVGPTRYKLPRWVIADLLELPTNGATKLRLAGPGADKYFQRLQKVVNRPAQDAQFVVIRNGITIRPDKDGLVVDVPKTAKALLAASVRRVNRVAPIAVASHPAKRTLADATAEDGAMYGRLMVVAAKRAKESGLAADGFRVVMNAGPGAGQTVFHVHLHVLAGRTLTWPPG
jgi:histidine triad (HIT) family protein